MLISGNEIPHFIGSSVTITCSSDLAARAILWIDSDGGVLFSNSGQQQLSLQIERVTSSLANVMYTCEVQARSGVLQETITFAVDGY